MFAFNKFFSSAVCVGAFAALAASGSAIPVIVDGTAGTYTTLSAAVDAAYAAEDGPDIITVTATALTVADTHQILLDKPITIIGNGCDVLVDTTAIAAETDKGVAGKAYFEVSAEGDVNISGLKVHPNAAGFNGTADASIASAVRCAKPAAGTGNFTFTNVEFSGSTSAGAFIPLADGSDLYGSSPLMWPSHSGADAAQRTRGMIYLDSAGGSGTYNTTFDHCKAGLTAGTVVNMHQDSGTHKILGGVYGHCGRDAFHIQGTGVTIQGTHDDRVRVLRSTNISAGNSHNIETFTGADVALIEYVDIANYLTANGLALQDGHIGTIRFVRVLGKFTTDTNNHAVYITGATTDVDLIENCTFHANSTGALGNIPLAIQPSITQPIIVRDSIFTSLGGANAGTVVIGPTVSAALPTITFSALPYDLVVNESLTTPPLSGDGAAGTTTSSITTVSPIYALTLSDYDWSDNQGVGKPGNALGNANVLRPTNPAYNGAGTAGTRLNGGAGAPAAGIDSSEWMLM